MYMSKDNAQRYTVGVRVDNEPGVLSRVSGLFFRRGFNIDSLAVGTTQDPEVSRITIVVKGDDAKIEQLVQQLYKLICVQKVQVLRPRNSVGRQLLLVSTASAPTIQCESMPISSHLGRDVPFAIAMLKSELISSFTATGSIIVSKGNSLLYTSQPLNIVRCV